MSAKTITRPQAIALRNAEELPEPLLSPFDALRGLLLISARPNTLASLVRMGLAEEIQGQHVLTRAGWNVRAITDLEYLPRLDTVASMVAATAEEDALAAEPQTRPDDATYRPNEEGAHSLATAHPMYRDGRRVSAIVENSGQDLYIFLGTETIYDGDVPEFVKGNGDLITFVRQYADGYDRAADYRTLWSYRDHKGHVWGPYADASYETNGSSEEHCRRIVDGMGEGEVIRVDRTPEHFETTGRNWTDVHTVVHAVGRFAEGPAEPSWTIVTGADIRPGDVIRLGSRRDPWVTVEDVNDAPHGAGLLWVDTAPVPGWPTLREVSRHQPITRAVTPA